MQAVLLAESAVWIDFMSVTDGILPSVELLQINYTFLSSSALLLLLTMREKHDEGCGKEGL